MQRGCQLSMRKGHIHGLKMAADHKEIKEEIINYCIFWP